MQAYVKPVPQYQGLFYPHAKSSWCSMCSAQFYLNYDHVFVRVHDIPYGSKSYKLKLLRKLVIKHGIRALFGGEVMCSNLTIVNLLIKPNKADCGCLIVNPNPINLTEYWFPHIFNSTLKKTIYFPPCPRSNQNLDLKWKLYLSLCHSSSLPFKLHNKPSKCRASNCNQWNRIKHTTLTITLQSTDP